jgi:hypothetical protein
MDGETVIGLEPRAPMLNAALQYQTVTGRDQFAADA